MARTARRLARVSLGTMLLLGSNPAVAHGQIVALTGVWAGKLTCKTYDAGAKETVAATPALAVTQLGNVVGMRMDFGGGVVQQYTGLASPDAKKPLTKGEVGIIRCGTDSAIAIEPAADEIGRLAVSTTPLPGIKATMKGGSVLSQPPSVGTCSWKWTRTAVDDPGVPTECPR
jgi:hypothetical protein